jgi:hypothetical protein
MNNKMRLNDPRVQARNIVRPSTQSRRGDAVETRFIASPQPFIIISSSVKDRSVQPHSENQSGASHPLINYELKITNYEYNHIIIVIRASVQDRSVQPHSENQSGASHLWKPERPEFRYESVCICLICTICVPPSRVGGRYPASRSGCIPTGCKFKFNYELRIFNFQL